MIIAIVILKSIDLGLCDKLVWSFKALYGSGNWNHCCSIGNQDELLNGEVFYNLAEAQILIEAWRKHYNTVRPQSSLGYRPPAPETATPPWLPSGSATLHLRAAMAPEAVLH
jgi:transposase InsO family protein